MLAAVFKTFKTVDWSTIQFYRPADFKHPEKLDDSVVRGLDRLAIALNRKARVLSDWRLRSQFSDSQHPIGRAIDFTYPDVDSTIVLNTIRDLGVFSGYGIYMNQAGAVSFHVDTRTDRSPQAPATWGARKGFAADEWAYTSLRSIVDVLKPHALPLIWVGILGVIIYFLARKS